MLMYSSKRYAYTPPVYRARSILAALDYNENVNREPIMNRDGTIRYVHSYMHAQYMYLYWYIGVFLYMYIHPIVDCRGRTIRSLGDGRCTQ